MNFETGLSGLRASQFAISTVAQNLANANTEGYHRQRVSFETRMPTRFQRQYLGSGVDIRTVDRMRSQIVENSYTVAISDLQNIDQRLSVEGQIESLFLPGPGSLQDSLNGFFDQLSSLSANPTEIVQRNSVVRKGVELANQIQTVSNKLSEVKSNVHKQVELEVDELNRQIRELVDLQAEISVASANGTPNDLLDRRDQLVNRIAEKIDIRRNEHVQSGFGLTISGQSISIGLSPIQFESHLDDSGNLQFRLEDSDRAIEFQSGRLNALQHVHNETIDYFQNNLNEFASGVIQNVDEVHAKGVGTEGPFTILKGSRSVASIDVPLDSAETAFPVEAGELFFSVTDANNERRTYSVAVDPATDTLQDVADRISNLPGLRGTASNQTNELSVSASPGYRFDFSGNLETTPDLSSFTGNSVARLSGQYEGDQNQQWRVEIAGPGTIGVTPGLQAQVFNQANELVGVLEIGENYEAGSELTVADGVKLSFRAGDVNAGDSFETQLVADSDTSGILAALGLNSFFRGNGASDIAVETHLIEDPNQLATSRTGENGDTANLAEMVGLRDKLVMGDERLSLDDFLGEVVSEIGFQVQTSQSLQQSVSSLKSNYAQQKDAISGVDLNEEMLNLAKFQKAYEASVQVIRTMETMMDELYQIIR